MKIIFLSNFLRVIGFNGIFCYNLRMSKEEKLGMEPYKGVRDFYPPDMFVQNYIFDVMRKVVESYGYVEYSASILEPGELYKAKTGEEIVNEQTYTFKDRADREVTLRPEMTPTVARMVARNRRELSLPARWYSIPNLFRYESPQRGRLREHWQLNADIFGVKSLEAEREIIAISYDIMREFGAKNEQFEIVINNRKIIQALYDYFEFSAPESYAVSKLIDKKQKISNEEFTSKVRAIVGNKTDEFIKILNSKDINSLESALPSELKENIGIQEIKNLLKELGELGIKNASFSPTLMRGFDYYTGIVFEVFDTGPKNNRSLFGGGRYDDLLDIFGSEKITAVGFGMGDVTIRDFLETYTLLPSYKPKTDLYICRVDEKFNKEINALGERLRKNGLNVAIDLLDRKIGDQIKAADKQGIPYVICVGDDEIKSGKYKVKNLKTSEEVTLEEKDIVKYIITKELN